MATDDWKPEGWDSWPQVRRTLWRREQQLERMKQLPADGDRAEALPILIEHLEDEIAELLRQLGDDATDRG